MVVGLDRFTRRMTKTIPDSVRRATAEAMERQAERLVGEMRRLVPVDEGTLRDSIGWTWGQAPAGTIALGTVGGRSYSTMRITIFAGGGDAFHARFQEFGTIKMKPTPFFFVSWRKLRRGIRSSITRAQKKAIRAS